MADRIEPFSVLIPSGTTVAAPQVTLLDFDDGIVTGIRIRIPPGPAGFVGFQFTHKGGQVIPFTGSNFIIADDEVIEWSVSNMPTANGWQLRAYNTDVYDHTIYVIFSIDEIPVGRPGPIPLIAL